MTTRRIGLVTVAIGLLVIVSAQLAGPQGGPPLYDGIVPIEPYRWLEPPPGHPGGAEGAEAIVRVVSGQSELVAVGTPELSPQAQVFATPGALTLPAGTTSIKVSIEPVAPVGEPADGYLDGNVYRILLTDQRGQPITAPEEARVSVVLRSADPAVLDATVERFDGTAWEKVRTSPPGVGSDSYVAIVTRFGDFAVVGSGTSPYPTGTPVAASQAAATSSPVRPEASTIAAPSPAPAVATGTGRPAAAIVAAILAGIVAILAVVIVRRRRRPNRGAQRQVRR